MESRAASPLSGLKLGKRKRGLDLPSDRHVQHDADSDDHDTADSRSNGSDDISETEATQLTPPTPISRASTPHASKIHPCPFDSCPKTFNRQSRLEEHIRSHNNTRIFRCQESSCDKSFLRKSHLSHHVKSAHTDERDHPCTWNDCGKSFHTASRLRRHVEGHQGRDRFRCDRPACDQTFRKHATLQRHINVEHMQLHPFPCLRTDETTGLSCSEGFATAAGLRAHEGREHATTRYWCSLCPSANQDEPLLNEQGFTSTTELQLHIAKEHPPQCHYCELICSSTQELSRHTQIRHSGSDVQQRKSLVCNEPACGKAFTKTSNLNAHRRSAHTSSKPFVCGQTDLSGSRGIESWDRSTACGNAFSAKHSLEGHVRSQHLRIASARRKRKSLDVSGQQKSAKRATRALISGQAHDDRATALLSCPSQACDQHFTEASAFETHARVTHAMADEDVEDAIREYAALTGGIFWLSHDEGEDMNDEASGMFIDPHLLATVQ